MWCIVEVLGQGDGWRWFTTSEPLWIRATNGSATNPQSSDVHDGLYSAVHGSHRISMCHDGEEWVPIDDASKWRGGAVRALVFADARS